MPDGRLACARCGNSAGTISFCPPLYGKSSCTVSNSVNYTEHFHVYCSGCGMEWIEYIESDFIPVVDSTKVETVMK